MGLKKDFFGTYSTLTHIVNIQAGMKLAYLKPTCFAILSWRHQIGSLGKTKHKPGIFLSVAIRNA